MRAGDIIVSSFEYEAFFEPSPVQLIDGVGVTTDANQAAARIGAHLDTWKQYLVLRKLCRG